MIWKILLGALLVGVVAGQSCEKTFENLDKCLTKGYAIAGCEAGDVTPTAEVKRKCRKILKRADRCGGYKCETEDGGDEDKVGWTEVVWPSLDDMTGFMIWQMYGEPITVEKGGNMLFTVRMNPLPGVAQDKSFYMGQMVQTYNENGRILTEAEIWYPKITPAGIYESKFKLTGKTVSDCSLNAEGLMSGLRDLTDYTTTMDTRGSFTAKGSGLDVSYSWVDNPDADCYRKIIQDATTIKISFWAANLDELVSDYIKIEYKGQAS